MQQQIEQIIQEKVRSNLPPVMFKDITLRFYKIHSFLWIEFHEAMFLATYQKVRWT